jgi:hypothetical protein
LDVTLQSIIDEINAAVGGVAGVNPEADTTGITFEYDQANDKMIVDGGELSPSSLNAGTGAWFPDRFIQFPPCITPS